jgi:hypothetical protein
MIWTTIVPRLTAFGTIGRNANHINASHEPLPEAGAGHERTLEAVRYSALILIEAPSSAYRRGLLALGKDKPPHEEETFYVGADVKLFLSSLRAATVLRALECVRRIRLKPPSIRVGLFPPNT